MRLEGAGYLGVFLRASVKSAVRIALLFCSLADLVPELLFFLVKPWGGGRWGGAGRRSERRAAGTSECSRGTVGVQVGPRVRGFGFCLRFRYAGLRVSGSARSCPSFSPSSRSPLLASPQVWTSSSRSGTLCRGFGDCRWFGLRGSEVRVRKVWVFRVVSVLRGGLVCRGSQV